MIKKYALFLIVFLCLTSIGYGQCLTDDFNSGYGNWTESGTYQNGTAGVTGNGTGFNSTGDEIITTTVLTNPDVITFWLARSSSTANKTFSVQYSTSNSGPWTTVRDILNGEVTTTHQEFTTNLGLTGDYYIRLAMTQRTGGSYYLDDITVTCSAGCSDAMDFANIQFPTASPQNITVGDAFDVYTQAVEPGVTNANATAPGIGVEAWIGYSTTNDDPGSGTGWNWIIANYNTDVGANDEFVAEIGSGLPVGTYYYASRYRLNGCDFTYGGTGGNWSNDSVQLNVNPHVLDWCNLQSPPNGAITTGSIFDVYGQVYELGVTDTPGAQGANIEGWIGYSTADTDPSGGGWTWIVAGYNNLCGANCGTPENNDEYFVDIGSGLSAGTYYYASRFRIDNDVFYYGGYNASGGGFWDGTNNVNGILTVTDPVIPDVVITEIMYNPPGANDYEWIELCNLNGTAQDLSNSTIRVNGTIRFTFPVASIVPANSCITILLGHVASSPPPECPFTPDYQNPVGTTNFLFNGGATIRLVASDNTTDIDVVAYDDADSNPTDGNGSSFHFDTAFIDNSDTDTNWVGVPDGGSPGTNSLVSPCTTFDPEINVEGDIGAFPDISDGDTTPSGTDNTLFAAQPIGGSQTKSYRIQNLGTADLTITAIDITGPNPGDFTVDPTLVFPIVISPSTLITFEITFSPTAAGQRDATVEIVNDDADENPYNYNVRGTGTCSAGSITISPSSGPVGTIVTVTGTNLGAASSASINAIAASVTVINPGTVIEVTIPSGAGTSNLEIIDDLGCVVSELFTVLTDDLTTCEGANVSIPAGWTGLMMSGVFDNSSGSCHYLELFNPTGAAINLTGYNIRLSNNQADANDPFGYTSAAQPLSGSIAAYSTFLIQFGNTGSTCSDCPNLTPDITIQDSAFGINGTGSGGIDRVVLLNGTTEIDFVANTDYPNAGYVYTRDITSTAPNMTFTNTDWDGQSVADCFGFQTGPFYDPPLISSNPSSSTSCDLTATLEVVATEGYAGGNPLAYQWYYSAPGDAGWTAVVDGATYSGANTAILTVLNTLNTIDYQFYCQVRENDATCYQSSDATRLDIQRTIWTSAWSDGPPDVNTIAVIDGIYITSSNGNIDACQLVVNSGANRSLEVSNSTYVRVVNDVLNNGIITIQTRGAFVQDGDDAAAGTYTNSGAGTSNVLKSTVVYNDAISGNYNYTYWSSPVFGSMINTVFPNPVGSRRYYFAGENFLDALAESANDNNLVAGQDDIDDNANDWIFATGQQMTVGRGYAVTAVPNPFPGSNYSDSANFIGELNTGNTTFTVYRNDSELNDNNWNFTGNPYPSAISADAFILENVYLASPAGGFPANPSGVLDGAIFLWSQSIPADANTNGNENLNFNQNDYAVINLTGETAGNSGVQPTRFIPSGQGFFVSYSDDAGTVGGGPVFNNTISFKNSMRIADMTSNNQFFGIEENIMNFNSDETNDPIASPHKIWIDLTSDNGVFNQILIGYVDGATQGFDGMKFDAVKNLSAEIYSSLYTLIDGNEKSFTIQGRAPEDLHINEIIPIGFSTIISQPTLYKLSISKLEGEFLTNNTIYLKDYHMDVTHNLSESDYVFTSDVGDFRERFEIVFTEDALSLGENEFDPNDLSIIELSNGDVKFKLNGNHLMQRIEIIDLLGRYLYILDAEDSSDNTYNLSNLSQAAYIAKVTLDNGYIITKKAVKRK